MNEWFDPPPTFETAVIAVFIVIGITLLYAISVTP